MIDVNSIPVKQRMYKLCDDKTEAHLRTALNRMLQYKELNRLLCGGVVYYYKDEVYVQINYRHDYAQKANVEKVHAFLNTCCYETDDLVTVVILDDPNTSFIEISLYSFISQVKV